MKRKKETLKKIPVTFIILMLLTILNINSPFAIETENRSNHTLSPYFFVKSDNPDIDQFPLKATSINVNIAGVIADVKVTQVYKNEGKRPIEAIYIFPASTKAAIYGMKMQIGERIIIAKIEKRKKARQAYEKAKREGKQASLLEEHRPNVFQMSVANIMPGDTIKTELRYTELISPKDGIYEFVYPTVVGPRYSTKSISEALPSENWVENPYLHQGRSPATNFDIKINLNSGVPLNSITSPSHKTVITYKGKSRARIVLAPKEKYSGNRDFILKYRLNGNVIQSGILLYKGKDENFFLLMVEPPKRISIDEVPPRDYIFIVDVSGSMRGFPLRISKRLIENIIKGLRQIDSFNILFFAGGSRILSPRSLKATPANISRALLMLKSYSGGGGTELLPALKRALSLPKDKNISRIVVIATDGYVTVEKEAFQIIRDNLGNANFFPFGIGTSVNRYIIEGMARAGKGEPFIVTKIEEAKYIAKKFFKYIQYPILTKINVNFEGFKAYDIEPKKIPDLFSLRPILVYGKWRDKIKGSVTITGVSGNKAYHKTIYLSNLKASSLNSALKYLWARERIAYLADYNRIGNTKECIRKITRLGLKYNLITPYTSFIAIDTTYKRDGEKLVTVKQPLPLPAGVSDWAIGRKSMPSLAISSFKGKALPQRVSTINNKAMDKESFELQETLKRENKNMEVKVLDLSIKGARDKNKIKEEIIKVIRELSLCIKKAGHIKKKSEIIVRLVIDYSGKIIEVKTDSGIEKRLDVKRCIEDRIKKWHFEHINWSNKTDIIARVFIY